MKIRIISGLRKIIRKDIFDGLLKLRYRIYLEEGFISANKKEEFGDYHDESGYHIIVIDGRKVIGGLSIMREPLPLNDIYLEEKTNLMRKFRMKKCVEFSRFVIDKEYRYGTGSNVSMKMFKLAYKYLFFNGIKMAFIAVHPKFKERYERKFGFKQYGVEKKYSSVRGNPAILMYQTRKMLYKILLRKLFGMKS